MTSEGLSHRVKQRAISLGFDTVGITDLSPPPHRDALAAWLARGMAGTMTYMNRQMARRMEPSRILPGARTAIVVTKSYSAHEPAAQPGTGRIAKYARGPDYHRALRPPLEALAQFVIELGPPGTLARTFVDAGPVPERELAQRAGLGWIGKNTMLIDPHRGSFFFLASVLTSLDLAVDLPFEADRCGTCRRCLDACPTGAIVEDRVLDGRRCISYLTIEYRGAIPDELAPSLGDWVFGCDVCQDVCPWNASFADRTATPDARLARVSLRALAEMTPETFDQEFGETALERAGPEGMRRNALVASGNSEREGPCLKP